MDITMTATLRPGIILRTIRSFKENLFWQGDFRLIVNIDPVGDTNISQGDVEQAIKKEFPSLLVRAPEQASFPGALKWAWDQVTTPYFFNLEDDWELTTKFDLTEMTDVMDRVSNLAILRFPKGCATEDVCQPSSSSKQPLYRWNGLYYQCPVGLAHRANYYGSPSLIRTAWVKQFTLDNSASPEKQFRRWKDKKDSRLAGWSYGVWSRPGVARAIVDIGTRWRHNHKIAKNSYTNFTKWSSNET